MKLLVSLCCLCLCGCESVRDASITGRLWRDREYVTPSSPDPHLALAQTENGILVQYNAVTERNGEVSRRAFYLEPNLKRIAHGEKPAFVDPAKAGPQTAIPILTNPTLSLCAVCSSNFSTFTLYREGRIIGPCELPVFRDSRQKATQIALTPLAVTGDATVVAAVAGTVWAALHASGDASGPGPGP